MSGIVGVVSRPEVWLMRHGETVWSAAGRHTGSTDVPLTDVGRVAARRLGAYVATQSFAAVFTSPLGRARETCELADLSGLAIVDEDLREWDYGDYEGLTTAEIRETRPDWTVWRDGCPGGEVADDVAARVDRVVGRLRERDGVIAVFGHGHCLRVLVARWVGLAAEDGALIALDTATVSRLGWEREQPVIRTWNVQP
jgi:broad specificity phosphatase PhoE